jgi:hypothetical protein
VTKPSPQFAPLTAQAPAPLGNRAPYSRRATQVGMVISPQLEALQEERSWELSNAAQEEERRAAEERAAAEEAQRREEAEAAERRRQALNEFLTKLEKREFDFAGRAKGLESMVTAAFAALGRSHGRTMVLATKKIEAMMREALPDVLIEAPTAALRQNIGELLEMKMLGLFAGSGISLSDLPIDVRTRIGVMAETLRGQLPKEVTAIIDADIVVDAYKATLAYHGKAILDGKHADKIVQFTMLWKQGWFPVGLLKDKSFLVIVK